MTTPTMIRTNGDEFPRAISSAMLDLIDLTEFDKSVSDRGAVLHIHRPDDEDKLLGPTITLAGIDSDVYRKTQTRLARKRVEQMARGKKITDDSFDDDLELLCACTIGWEGIGLDGEELICTPENKKKLYQRLPWLRDQAARFLGDRSKYFRPASGQPDGAASA